MKTKSYTISYGKRLLGKEKGEIQYACSFKITPDEDPPGREFCFDISLKEFRQWASHWHIRAEDEEEYTELVGLHCGIEETISVLNGGIEQDEFPIGPLTALACQREYLESCKDTLLRFKGGMPILFYKGQTVEEVWLIASVYA